MDIRAKIARTAVAKSEARLTAMDWDTSWFDRIVPHGEWTQRAGTIVRAAFDEYVALNSSSWQCRVVFAYEMNLPFAITSAIGTYFPEGGAIRYSSIFGIVGTPTPNDPFFALFYNGAAQRAFWVTQLWDGQVSIDPVTLKELSTDGMLERADAFGTRLLAWERKHPPVNIGLEPYPRYGIPV